MTLTTMDQPAAEPPASSGWEANLSLGFTRQGNRTILSHRRRKGPLVVQQPFSPDGKACHVYLVHPPGGVVGGDHLSTTIDAADHTDVLVTTPGATKFYRSAGRTAHQEQHLAVQNGALLQWLPLENIHFSGAKVRIETAVNLNQSGRLVLWDIHCFGRPASDERFDEGAVDTSISICRDGRLLFTERQRTSAQNIKSLSLMAGHAVTGTLIASDVEAAHVEACREIVATARGNLFGVTRVEDLLLARYLGDSTEEARLGFIRIWKQLQMCRTGAPGTVPRIWHT